MRFLRDENLSPLVAKALVELGHDAVHVDELGHRAFRTTGSWLWPPASPA